MSSREFIVAGRLPGTFMVNDGSSHWECDDCVRHVGLPVACAGCIQIGNIIHIDSEAFVVTKVGGAAFDMVPVDDAAGDDPHVQGMDAMRERADVTLTIYGKGNRWGQADWLRRLADVLERQAMEDGDEPTDPSRLPQVVASGDDPTYREWRAM